MPKVSIILPVYNVSSYLDEAMQSLLAQTFHDFEIIAVNDGSTDNSLEILEKYAAQDSRIACYSQHNQGQSAARNLALQHAQGEYIYFMDSDDTISPDAIRKCHDYICSTNADFIFFDADIAYEEGSTTIPWNYKRTHLLKEHQPYSGDFLLNMMLDNGKHSCVVWALFIRRKFLDQIQLSFYPGIIHEDELFTTILTLSSHHVFCLQQSLVSHRVRRSSTMGIRYSERNINGYLTVIDELLKFQDSPLVRKFARYTLSKVFYTGHILPFAQKVRVFLRAAKSGYLPFIGSKSILVFWLKR